MDKFLEIVYEGQFEERKMTDKYMEFFKPTLDKLKGILSHEFYETIEEEFIDNAVDSNRFYAVEGMKLAMGIMDGTYIPFV